MENYSLNGSGGPPDFCKLTSEAVFGKQENL